MEKSDLLSALVGYSNFDLLILLCAPSMLLFKNGPFVELSAFLFLVFLSGAAAMKQFSSKLVAGLLIGPIMPLPLDLLNGFVYLIVGITELALLLKIFEFLAV